MNKYLSLPLVKAIVHPLLLIIGGLLSSSLIVEITNDNGVLEWDSVYGSKSFLGLLVFLFINVLYTKFIYDDTESVKNFMDTGYCRAYYRRTLLEQHKKEAQKGNFIEIEEQLKRWID